MNDLTALLPPETSPPARRGCPLPPEVRLAAIVPRPADLTPADTSSYLVPALAQALRKYHPFVDEFALPLNPSDGPLRQGTIGLRYNSPMPAELEFSIMAESPANIQPLLDQFEAEHRTPGEL